MKVWRNSEGCEFMVDDLGSPISDGYGSFTVPVGALGYVLVEKEEPGEFEAQAYEIDKAGPPVISSRCLIPGELYSVRKVKR